MVLQILYLIGSVLLLLSLYFRYSYAGRLISKIPGPIRIPIFGNLLSMYKSPEHLFRDLRLWHNKYGRLWKLEGAHIRAVHLYHPEDVEKILSTTQHNQKDLPYTFMQGWLGEGLLVSNGQKWHQRRKMLTPAFHFNILNKFFRTFCEHAQDLLDTLEQEADKERTNLAPLISKTTLLVMCDTSLGTKLHKDSPTIDTYLKYIYKIGLHVFTKGLIEEKRKNRTDSGDVATKDETRDEMYEKRIKPALLDLLLNEEDKGTINDDEVREEVDTFVFEGHDTIASALIFMIMRIANEPEIQNAIHEELKSIYGDSKKPPSIDDLTRMKYLECCIKESLRLYPSVPFMSRYITEEVVIAGYRIPKNSYLDIHVFDIHRNPELYPEPEKFIPERFLPENMVKRHPYSYIPFSAGPRNCIGQRFALMEMKTLMSEVLRKYQLEPITKVEDIVFTSGLVLRTNHPIYVRFCRREESQK